MISVKNGSDIVLGNNFYRKGRVSNPSITLDGNIWYHVVMNWDVPNDVVETYVDGVLIFTDNINPSKLYQGPWGTTTLSVGKRTGAKSNHFFGGCLDEVAIWSRPLDVGEVGALYSQGSNELVCE